MFKYRHQNISVSITLLDAVSWHLPIGYVKPLTCETPDFIASTFWPANSPELSPVDYQIWGKQQEHMYHSQIRDVGQLKSRFIKEWEYFNQIIN